MKLPPVIPGLEANPMSTLECFIRNYGYLAILVGAIVEGETILLMGGMAAQMGYLELPLVIVSAFTGAISGDFFFFFLGRWQGLKLRSRNPAWLAGLARLQDMLERHHSFAILSFRFLYGLRVVAPLAVGLSRVRMRKFILLDALSALAWATSMGLAGYLFGQVLALVLGDVRRYELEAMGVIGLAGILAWLTYFFRRRKAKAAALPVEGQ